MKLYNIDVINIFVKALAFSLILNIFFFVGTKNYDLTSFILATLIIIVVEFVISFMSKKLIKIEIDDNYVRLHFLKFIMVKQIEIISLEDFQFSYKEEYGAKGVKIEQLRFYRKNVKIIGIGKSFDGWKEKSIFQIINDFRTKGITEIK